MASADRKLWVWGLPWSMLGGVGSSFVARATILIPIIGYMIIFNEKVVQYFNLSTVVGGYQLHGQIAISPRLLLVYFGLCAIAAGVGLFAIFCPSEVKQYRTMNGYLLGDGPVIKEFALTGIGEKLRNSNLSDIYAKIESSLQGKFATDDEERIEVHNATLRLFYYHLEWSLSKARHVVLLFYVVGFICLAIPSLGVFLRVARVLFSAVSKDFGLVF